MGTRTLVDLLNAEQELHQVRFDLVNARYEILRQEMDCLFHSGRQRVESISSILSSQRPPPARASRAPSTADKAWPRCSNPLGEGAKRVTGCAACIGA